VKTIQVETASASYAVVCERGALGRLRSSVEKLKDGGDVFVLSSPRVWRSCGKEIERALRDSHRCLVLFDDREVAKRLTTVERICRKLAHARADRRALLIAVGGGVVGDVAGFAAATYLRGVRIVHVPTTLVAQVDSAIGGKTGVDLAEGKNLVGVFHQPELVIADPLLLRTLPARQFRSGLYEIVKYGVIGDAELFDFLEREVEKLLDMNMRTLEFVIERGARQKAAVVSKDEHEGGLRQILNFGHTIGHALETLTEYKHFLHGEAVGWGMLGATQIAVALELLPKQDATRISSLVARCGPLPVLPRASAAELLETIAGDKKSRAGRVGWVLPRAIGNAQVGVNVADDLVAEVWHDLLAIYANASRGA